MKNQDWITINVEALVHRSELPPMTKEQERMFASRLSQILGEYLPSGQDWLDCIDSALDRVGATLYTD